jgi:hypothetical protein
MTLLLPEIDEALMLAAQRRVHSRPGPLRWLRLRGRGRAFSRPLVVAITVLGVSGSLGGLALAGTFNTGTISPQAWLNGQRVTPEAAATPDQTASLAILQRPVAATDALPAYYLQVLTNTPAGGAEGVNVSLARRAYGFPDGGAAWVMPANDGLVCLVAANAQALQEISEPTSAPPTHVPGADDVTTCQAAATINTGWPLGYGHGPGDPPGENFTGGIVPDGASQITIGVVGGATTTFPVYDNVWMGYVPGAPDSESFFSGPTGPVTSTWAAGANPAQTQVPAACKRLQAEHHGGVC